MSSTSQRSLRGWVTLIAVVILGSFPLALALAPVLAQSSQSSDALDSYDANENGQIDEAEFIKAVG